MVDYTEYRLAFVLPGSLQLLGMRCFGSGVVLPRVSIPTWERPAEQLTRVIEEKWNIKTLVLDLLADESAQAQCAVIEVRSPSWQFTDDGLTPVLPNMIFSLFPTETERRKLQAILAGEDSIESPFSRIGWIEEVQTWIRSAVSDRRVVFTDTVRHLNAGGGFCLLRLATASGQAYWLKAVGEPNRHEFTTTAYLAQHCPKHLPKIVAMRHDWNAWVMEEFGCSLNSLSSFGCFELAVVKLASLQKHFVGRSEELLAAKFLDHRTVRLEAQIDELVDYLVEAMCHQTSVKVSSLSPSRIREIGTILHSACNAMEDLGIPDSVMHSDISPGSILCNGGDCVFTDWCEAYVGNPFITLEQLCAHTSRRSHASEPNTGRLISLYRACWKDLLTERQIEKTLRIVPLISVLSYLYGRGDWLHSQRRDQEATRSYSRSLARHLDRIAANAALTEAICNPS
jgi:hypothetical protein